MTAVVSSRRSSYASNASSIELPDYGSIVVLKRTDGKDGAVFPIEDNTVTFGKHEDNDIRINRPCVDEHHAILSVHQDLTKVEIHNLSKIHSIKVGSFMIRPEQRSIILGKDIIEISDRRFRFEKSETLTRLQSADKKRQRSDARIADAQASRRKSIATVTSIRHNGQLELKLTPRKARRSKPRNSRVFVFIQNLIVLHIFEGLSERRRSLGDFIRGDESKNQVGTLKETTFDKMVDKENVFESFKGKVLSTPSKSPSDAKVLRDVKDETIGGEKDAGSSPETKSRRLSALGSIENKKTPEHVKKNSGDRRQSALLRESVGEELPVDTVTTPRFRLSKFLPVNAIFSPKRLLQDLRGGSKDNSITSSAEDTNIAVEQSVRSDVEGEAETPCSPAHGEEDSLKDVAISSGETSGKESPLEGSRTPRMSLSKELPVNAVSTPTFRISRELPVNAVKTPEAPAVESEALTPRYESTNSMAADPGTPKSQIMDTEYTPSVRVTRSRSRNVANTPAQANPRHSAGSVAKTPGSNYENELPIEALVTPRIRLSKELPVNAVATPKRVPQAIPVAADIQLNAEDQELQQTPEPPIAEAPPMDGFVTPNMNHEKELSVNLGTSPRMRMSTELPVNAATTPNFRLAKELPVNAITSPRVRLAKELPVNALATPSVRLTKESLLDEARTPNARLSQQLPEAVGTSPVLFAKELPTDAVMTPRVRLSKELPVNSVATPCVRYPELPREDAATPRIRVSGELPLDAVTTPRVRLAKELPVNAVATPANPKDSVDMCNDSGKQEPIETAIASCGISQDNVRNILSHTRAAKRVSSSPMVSALEKQNGSDTPSSARASVPDARPLSTPRRSTRLSQQQAKRALSVSPQVRTINFTEESCDQIQRDSYSQSISSTPQGSFSPVDGCPKGQSPEGESTTEIATDLSHEQDFANSPALSEEVQHDSASSDGASMDMQVLSSHLRKLPSRTEDEASATRQQAQQSESHASPQVSSRSSVRDISPSPVRFALESKWRAKVNLICVRGDLQDVHIRLASSREPEERSCLKTPNSCASSRRRKCVFFADAVGAGIELASGAHYSPKREIRRSTAGNLSPQTLGNVPLSNVLCEAPSLGDGERRERPAGVDDMKPLSLRESFDASGEKENMNSANVENASEIKSERSEVTRAESMCEGEDSQSGAPEGEPKSPQSVLWSMTVVLLRRILYVKGASTKGRKAELVSRILESFAEDELTALLSVSRDDRAWHDNAQLKAKLESLRIDVLVDIETPAA
ncbi:hypothetical protein NDN08_000678 [Rhodosorus marinus]|uniref:SAP domain-containing protein n=1 Tax=Rhodosorus marinus TaxID=101924 RepID=A0AAV8UUB8_9RHOD|nr:hypothetical protein NDN08_000678 [Rhodosorus marinus]